MTTQSDAPAKPRAKVNLARIAFVVIVAVLVLWYFGLFKPSPQIALVTASDTAYWDPVIAGAEEAARLNDVKLTIIRSKPDALAQASAIKDLLSQHLDGIAISPVNPVTQGGMLSDAADATLLVTVDSDSPVSRRLCFVGTDNYFAGRSSGQQVRQAVPAGGEVIICAPNLDKENAQRRRQGVIDELLDRSIESARPADAADASLKGDKYTIISTLMDDSNPQTATDLAVKAIKDHPNVKCFVGLHSYNAPALLAALEQSKKIGQIQIVGFDVDRRTLDGIEAGSVFATILQDQRGMGYHAVQILAENARGNRSGLPMFQRVTLPCDVVTRTNVMAMRAKLEGGAAAAMPTTMPK